MRVVFLCAFVTLWLMDGRAGTPILLMRSRRLNRISKIWKRKIGKSRCKIKHEDTKDVSNSLCLRVFVVNVWTDTETRPPISESPLVWQARAPLHYRERLARGSRFRWIDGRRRIQGAADRGERDVRRSARLAALTDREG